METRGKIRYIAIRYIIQRQLPSDHSRRDGSRTVLPFASDVVEHVPKKKKMWRLRLHYLIIIQFNFGNLK